MGMNVKHYSKDGKEHKGGYHKMPDGKLHSGKTHSVLLSHYFITETFLNLLKIKLESLGRYNAKEKS